MRYNVHTHPRATRYTVARLIGVFACSALVAVLGLPSAAQAQAPAAPTVTGTGDGMVGGGTVNAAWGEPLGGDSGQDQWLLEYTEPGVAWDDAEKEVIEALITMDFMVPADDPRIHHGVWRFRVSYYDADLDPDNDIDDLAPAVIGTVSAVTDYHHGPPPTAPTGFTAYPAGPDARRLVWDAVSGLMYELRYTADATDPMEWTMWAAAMSGHTAEKLEMGTEYVFELRGSGESRAGVGDLFGPSATITEMMPVPTPTLSEWGALFLGMFLMVGGMYYTRRRMAFPQLTA